MSVGRHVVQLGGSSLQVWGCISANEVVDLVMINGVLNAKTHKKTKLIQQISPPRCLQPPTHEFLLKLERFSLLFIYCILLTDENKQFQHFHF